MRCITIKYIYDIKYIFNTWYVLFCNKNVINLIAFSTHVLSYILSVWVEKLLLGTYFCRIHFDQERNVSYDFHA